MLRPNPLPFLPSGRALRRYRTALQAALAAEPVAQLLPNLLSLPLQLAPFPDAAAVLAHPGPLALIGPPASGRTLAMLQLARSWAEGGAAGALLYLPLAELDAPNLSPRAVIADAATRVGLSPTLADGGRSGLLLLDDWELLSADRRAVWQAMLTTTAPRWRALRAVIALPPGEIWPGLHPLWLSQPDAATASAWLTHLLPGHDLEPILAALEREPLAPLLHSLADLALLALTYPIAGLATSRTELYEQAYALVRPLLGEDGALAQRGQAAEGAGGEPPLPVLGPGATPHIGRALLRHYRLARGFAGGDDLEALANLAPAERVAVAPLAAGLLDDPTPVLAALWRDGQPELGDLQALAACAAESPRRGPLWGLRLVERLADPAAPPEERALLERIGPALPALLAAAATADEPRASAALVAACAALPDKAPLCLGLIDDSSAPERLRWAAADLLADGAVAPELLAAPPSDDRTALAARCFVAATAGPATLSLLASEPLRDGLAALLADTAAGERRTAAARAVASAAELPDELRALALSAAGDQFLVERSAAESSPTMRRAALEALADGPPEEAIAAIGRNLALPETSELARREALDVAARLDSPAATGLLARVAIDSAQSLAVRLHAVDLLAGRGHGGMLVLQRLAAAGLPAVLRAAAVGHLGRLGAAEALPLLRNLLEASGPPLLRRAAASALGALGRHPALRDQAAAALITGLRRLGVDTLLGERLAKALGHTGANAALAILASLLAPSLETALRTAWLRRVPELATVPATAWPDLPLADDTRRALMDALADGSTTADPPNSFDELTARQAARIAATAASAIADLVDARPDLRPAALAALRQAAAGELRTDVARAILDALGRAGYAAAELAAILDAPSTPTLRWLAIERLGVAEGARDALQRRLAEGQDDRFLQGAIIALLGEHRHSAALPTLRRLARASEAEPQLRRAAMVALGRIPEPEAAQALAAIAADGNTPTELRIAAADALPADLSADVRAMLRQAARAARTAELGVALSRALARAGDREALPALVRSAQSDHGADAVASIEAIARLGDESTAPLLVRVSQSPTAAPGVRLAAVIALLQLCGAEYEALLRDYLAAPSPPLRLQAYAALAELRPDDPRLGEPLVALDAPLALRLQILRHLAAIGPDAPIVRAVVAASDEQPQLRLVAAAALEKARDPAAAEALAAALVAPPDEPLALPVLRWRCISALGTLARSGGPAADAARERLTAIAADASQPPEHLQWAGEALLGC